MRIGKLENSELESLILSKFKRIRPESLTVPRVGEDCAALDFDGDLIVMSMDPITSAGDKSLGLLSVHVNCNDAICMGAEPVGLLVTLLLPPDYPTEGIGRIADDLVMTKSAGLEGTAILATEHAQQLSSLSPALLREAEGYFSLLSIVPEGTIALQQGVHAMHDVTEGGVLGASWEIAYAGGLGLVLDRNAIPLTEATRQIAQKAGIDPLRLLGSGSLLIGCADGTAMVSALQTAGIPAAVIGHVVEKGVAFSDGAIVDPPQEDALYDAFRP